VSALAESFPYISLDKTGRYLFAVEEDGRVAPEPVQMIPVGRNAHSIRTDESNRFVFVPTLGSDEIFQFTFDSTTGQLTSNTPAVYLTKPGLGPRHFITSSDNKFVYVVSELTGTVTKFSLNSGSGLLTEVSSASGLSSESKLVSGAPRRFTQTRSCARYFGWARRSDLLSAFSEPATGASRRFSKSAPNRNPSAILF
jgi:6-phosphogluconolactonase